MIEDEVNALDPAELLAEGRIWLARAEHDPDFTRQMIPAIRYDLESVADRLDDAALDQWRGWCIRERERNGGLPPQQEPSEPSVRRWAL